MARYNNMDESERALFTMEYKQTADPVFNGRHLVHDVHVALFPDSDLAFNSGR